MSLAFTIVDLRQCPEFFDTVADRIWQAWWKPHGHQLTYITGRLRESMEPGPIPLALVVNELVTNAAKYAFADRPDGQIWVELRQSDSRTAVVSVRDDGLGEESRKPSCFADVAQGV